jgi:hypothetical protein
MLRYGNGPVSIEVLSSSRRGIRMLGHNYALPLQFQLHVTRFLEAVVLRIEKQPAAERCEVMNHVLYMVELAAQLKHMRQGGSVRTIGFVLRICMNFFRRHVQCRAYNYISTPHAGLYRYLCSLLSREMSLEIGASKLVVEKPAYRMDFSSSGVMERMVDFETRTKEYLGRDGAGGGGVGVWKRERLLCKFAACLGLQIQVEGVRTGNDEEEDEELKIAEMMFSSTIGRTLIGVDLLERYMMWKC